MINHPACIKWIVYILLFMLPFGLPAFSQTAPGGIGNSDGSDGQPEIKLWLLPDSLSLSDGADVGTWLDYSGNGNDLSQGNSSYTPVYRENGADINSHNYLEFSKDNNRIIRNPFDMPTDAVAVFMVLRTNDSGDGLLSYASSVTDNEYLFFRSENLNTYIGANNDGSGVSYNDDNWKVFSHQWRNSDGRLLIHLNGNEEYNINYRAGYTLNPNGAIAIGGEQDGLNSGYDAPQDYDGDIAEVIMYGSSLQQAQRTVIENYLAEKYGLNGNLPYDYYIPDESSYTWDLTGMGRESDGIIDARCRGLVITQNGGFDTGEYIFAAHDGTDNSINTSPNVTHSEVEATWQRDWYLDTTGTVNANLAFDMSEGINGDFPANIYNYRLMYRSSTGVPYDTLEVTAKGVQNGDQIYFSVNDAQLDDGYYTLGTVDQTNSPLDGVEGRTWYTLISGDWYNPEVWTLDPSGALPSNPNDYTPTTSPTSNADQVVILSGKTVTVSSGSKTNSRLTVEGRLDLQSTSGHSFGQIRGNGRILLSGDNFPSGDASHFYTPGQGEGTVEYYGTSFDLSRSLIFYDLEVNLNATSESITLLNDYNVHGNMTIERGRFRINDDASTTSLNINVHGDLLVQEDGSLLTGTADARHQLNLYGDLTNRGTIEFTNRTSADYGSEANDGIVDANFLNDSKDQEILCDGPTNFYRIEIDKGSDDTYILSIESTNASYFNLYGYAGQGHGSTAQLTDNANALGLIRGTARIGNQVDIPVLSTGGNYNISESARLWVAGGYVAKNNGNSLVPYGKIRVSDGSLEAEVSSGITTRENGLIKIEGGTLRTNQIRTSVLGASNVGGYVQSGGTTHILGGSTNTDYYCFTLTYPGNVFSMTGGTLHIHESHGRGGIFIASDDANQNVTGGTVVMDIDDGEDFPITSTAPFYNVSMRNNSGGSGQHILTGGTDVGATDEDLPAQPLIVLNDLTIGNGTGSIADDVFNHNGQDVTIGGDFTIETDGSYYFGDPASLEPSSGISLPYTTPSSHENYTTFNGTGNASISLKNLDPNDDDTWDSWTRIQPFHSIRVNKTDGSTVTLEAPNRFPTNNAMLISTSGSFTLESGVLDNHRHSIFFYGDVTNKGQIGLYEDGTDEVWALLKFPQNDMTISTEEGAIFGNMRLSNDAHIMAFTSDVVIQRLQYTHGRIYIDKHNLTIENLDIQLNGVADANGQCSGCFSIEDMIATRGYASDGGLTLKIPQDGNNAPGSLNSYESQFGSVYNFPQTSNFPDATFNEEYFLFPVGIRQSTSGEGTVDTDYFIPLLIDLGDVSVSTDGDEYITVTPVFGELQTTNLSGGDYLDLYWQIDARGFDGDIQVNQIQAYAYNDLMSSYGGSGMVNGPDASTNNSVSGGVLNSGTFQRFEDAEPAADPNLEGLATEYAEGPHFEVLYNGADDNVESDGTTPSNDYSEWGDASSTTLGVGPINLSDVNLVFAEENRYDGSPEIFYNERNGPWDGRDWDNSDSWFMDEASTTPATDYPQSGDIAVIRGDDYHDGITVHGTQDAAKVVFRREGTYQDMEDLPRLRLEPTDQLNVQTINGVGDIYLRHSMSSSADLNADIGEFASNDTSIVQFYMTENGTYNVSESEFFSELPTLRVYGQTSGYNREATFNYDLDCKNLIVDGQARLIMGGNYQVEHQTRLGYTSYGSIQYPNGSTPYSLTTQDLLIQNGKNQDDENLHRLEVEGGNTYGVEHRLEVNRNIELNYYDVENASDNVVFDLYNSTGENNVVLELNGTTNGSFTNHYSSGNYTVELYKILMNKGIDPSTAFTFNDDFTLSGPTSGADVEKALIMEDGHLILDDPDIRMNLTTGDDPFEIPGTSTLEVRQGQVDASGNSGILLDGTLQVSGGTANMTGGDNYIHYSASGDATIDVSAGSLIVGSQIRRGLTSTEGILNYYQSGGTVVVGNDAASENNRGVLEILNDGSHFSHTGGDLFIARAQDNPSTASLYLDPQTTQFGEGSFIHFGHTSTPANETMGIYSTATLPNVVVNNDNGSNPTLRQWTLPLTVTDSLEIDAGSTYDAMGLNLIMGGDFIAPGTFIPGNNTTYFSGNNQQEITGSPEFWNLIKDHNNTLRLNDPITVSNELHLQAGTLNDGGNTLQARGHVWMDATHTHESGGGGIAFNGDEMQMLRSDGGNAVFDRLTIDNAGGADSIAVSVPEGNDLRIQHSLNMKRGIFDIGKNLLVLEQDAIIEESNAFSTHNMIQTNISFTDIGVKKYFPEISSLTTFIYPIGSGGKFTPVIFNISQMNANGSIRVKAADEIHPTITNDDEPCQEITDTTNVLKYHWLMEAEDVSNFDGSVWMHYDENDVQIDNTLSSTSYGIDDYITARLLLGSTQWNKYDPVSFEQTNKRLAFTFTGADDEAISGDYTAGVEDPGGTCEGAIPDKVPAYVTKQAGSWTNADTWETYPDGTNDVPSTGPRGAIAIIEHEVTVPQNYILNYKTTIDSGDVVNGILKINDTYGHRLGIVDGIGTLQVERGDLPAGIYGEFFSDAGGTLEYASSDDYDVLGGISQLNNLRFSGTGERRLANLDIGLYGNLEIIGNDNTLRVINEHDKRLEIEENITFSRGSFDAGAGTNAIVRMSGSTTQRITGSFEGTNAFNRVELNNASGLEMLDSVEIDEIFTLNSGMVYMPDTALITLNSTSSGALTGAGSSRYIQGPLRKRISNGESYAFETGDTSRYGPLTLSATSPQTPQYWEVQYYNNNPDGYGYDTSSYASPLEEISGNEFWRVKGPGGQSHVTIRWDDQSALPAQTDDRLANLRLTEYLSGQWEEVGSDVTDNGPTDGTIQTDDPVDLEEHVFTLGTREAEPQATATFLTEDTTVCDGEPIELTVELTGDPDPDWTLEVDENGTTETYTPASSPFTFQVTASADQALHEGTYSIVSVSDANGTGNVYGNDIYVAVSDFPVQYEVGGGGTICSDSSAPIGLTSSQLGVTYELYDGGATPVQTVSGTGDSITFGYFSTAGTYTAEAVNSNGCRIQMTGSVDITVNQLPDPDPYAGQNPVCYENNLSVNLYANDAGGYTYTWSPSGELNDPAVANPEFQPASNPAAEADTTWFTVEVDNNGCVGVDSLQMILYRQPQTGNMYFVPNDFDQN